MRRGLVGYTRFARFEPTLRDRVEPAVANAPCQVPLPHRDPPKALKARPWIAKGEIHEVDGTLERLKTLASLEQCRNVILKHI
ncbi:MAG: hypothetical protein RBU29_15055 [bacterium]|nr:hypothetical protein [bacterium]